MAQIHRLRCADADEFLQTCSCLLQLTAAQSQTSGSELSLKYKTSLPFCWLPIVRNSQIITVGGGVTMKCGRMTDLSNIQSEVMFQTFSSS